MKRVSQLLMAAGLFAFGAYNVLVFQEIRVISRFCGNQYKETQESPPTFESVVMFAHDIAKNNQIHPPLFTSFTRLGKHFRSKSHANCGDVSQLAAEIGDELNLDIREVQILDSACQQAKHVVVFHESDSGIAFADPLLGYVYPYKISPDSVLHNFQPFWEKCLRAMPNKLVHTFQPECDIRFTNLNFLGLSHDSWPQIALNEVRFVFARYKSDASLTLGILGMLCSLGLMLKSLYPQWRPF